MLLIPVIVLRHGKSAWSLPGAQAGHDDPVRIARHWLEAGAQRLHLLDEDNEAGGKSANAACVRDIVAACDGMPVQLAAGVRSEDHAAVYFDAGIEYLVLATRALSAPHLVNNLCLEYPGHIIVSLDIRDGRLAAEGWSKHANHDMRDVAGHFHQEGVTAVICNALRETPSTGTDPDVAVTLAREVAVPVIAADGLATLAQLKRLCAADGGALAGAMLGEALYGGKLDFGKAAKLAAPTAT